MGSKYKISSSRHSNREKLKTDYRYSILYPSAGISILALFVANFPLITSDFVNDLASVLIYVSYLAIVVEYLRVSTFVWVDRVLPLSLSRNVINSLWQIIFLFFTAILTLFDRSFGALIVITSMITIVLCYGYDNIEVENNGLFFPILTSSTSLLTLFVITLETIIRLEPIAVYFLIILLTIVVIATLIYNRQI